MQPVVNTREPWRHIETRVREFLKSSPGLYDSASPSECIRAAYEAYGRVGPIANFETCLKRYGFVPREIGPGVHRLTLLSAKISPYPDE